MDVETFVTFAKDHFERVGKLDSPGGKKLWGMIVGDVDQKVCVELLEAYAFKGDKFPSPKGFADELAWRTRAGTDLPQQITTDDGHDLCPTCHEPQWWWMQGDTKMKMRGSGGCLFREEEGVWYAARCYTCGGAERHKRLPFPHPMHRPHWKPWFEAEPLKALRMRAEEAWFARGVIDRDEASEALSAWLGAAETASTEAT